jgi:hypothetical protein
VCWRKNAAGAGRQRQFKVPRGRDEKAQGQATKECSPGFAHQNESALKGRNRMPSALGQRLVHFRRSHPTRVPSETRGCCAPSGLVRFLDANPGPRFARPWAFSCRPVGTSSARRKAQGATLSLRDHCPASFSPRYASRRICMLCRMGMRPARCARSWVIQPMFPVAATSAPLAAMLFAFSAPR